MRAMGPLIRIRLAALGRRGNAETGGAPHKVKRIHIRGDRSRMKVNDDATGFATPVLIAPGPGDRLFDAARSLGDANRKYVGLLTFEAWRDYAERGNIVVVVEPGRDVEDGDLPPILGYAAYRTPRNEVVLAHLVVHPNARRRGVARLLVEHLSKTYPERRGIAAKCRADFPANGMWPRLGFVPLGSQPGRGHDRRPLTYWWRDHGHPDLMTWSGPPSSVLPVVMDANVFIDLHGQQPGGDAVRTRQIINEVLESRLELLVTPEIYSEIDRRKDEKDRDRLRSIVASQYPRLPVHAGTADAQVQALTEALDYPPQSPQDRSDLSHIAYAAAAGVATVVTRDNPVLRRLRVPAAHVVGVDVVSPEELVALVDEAEAAPAYMPAALLGTGYRIREASATDDALLRRFYSTSSGERLKQYEGRLRALAAKRPSASRLLIVDPAGEAAVLLGVRPEDTTLAVQLIRMVATALQPTLAAQVASLLRLEAVNRGLLSIRVDDPHAHPLVVDALLRDGFYLTNGHASGLALPVLTRMSDLEASIHAALPTPLPKHLSAMPWLSAARDLRTAPTPQAALSLERHLRPLCIVDAPVDVWLVPIRPQYSAALFGYPQELFDRPDELGISVEHVYYRGGRSGEAAPARVLWYVSGEREGVVMGRSELVEVIDGPWEAVYRRFRRLGVYRRDDVMTSADAAGNVRALRVINTEVFPRPLPLRSLRRFAERTRAGLQLQSPMRVAPAMFSEIMEAVQA